MDSVKIKDKKNTRMVAHKGLSGIERENTVASFIAAANRSYFGIEADVHLTADGKFVVIHDKNTLSMSGVDLCVHDENFDKIREINLYDSDGTPRADLKIPSLEEYIRVCKRYDKEAVLELKYIMPKEAIEEICNIIKQLNYLEKTTFISFDIENLICVRELYSNVQIQYLTCEFNDETVKLLKKYNMDLDIDYPSVNKELVDRCHSEGIVVNCWTVDDIGIANELINMGVDFITTNILE